MEQPRNWSPAGIPNVFRLLLKEVPARTTVHISLATRRARPPDVVMRIGGHIADASESALWILPR